MAEVIALVSIVSGALVAIAVPFISARLERSRLEEQSRAARATELRDLLDTALQHIDAAASTLSDIRDATTAGQHEPAAFANLGQRLTKQADIVRQDSIRIQIRTATDAAIALRHKELSRLLGAYELSFREFRLGEQAGPPADPLEDLQRAASELMKAVREFAGLAPAPHRPS